MQVPYTGSTALEPSAPSCEPPSEGKRLDRLLGWNYPGRAWEAEFFNAYGVEPDRARIDYYRRLWQAFDRTPDDTSG